MARNALSCVHKQSLTFWPERARAQVWSNPWPGEWREIIWGGGGSWEILYTTLLMSLSRSRLFCDEKRPFADTQRFRQRVLFKCPFLVSSLGSITLHRSSTCLLIRMPLHCSSDFLKRGTPSIFLLLNRESPVGSTSLCVRAHPLTTCRITSTTNQSASSLRTLCPVHTLRSREPVSNSQAAPKGCSS